MLPPFNPRGDLPAGIHPAGWAEIESRFGQGASRRRLLATLRHLHALAAQTGHLKRYLVFGSFVSSTDVPRDVDLVLVMAGIFRVEEASRESRTLFSHADAEARFNASVFWVREGMLAPEAMSAFLDVWQTRRDGEQRGIVEVTS